MDQEIEEQIRTRAYAIWEAEGRPEGQEFAHWAQAAQELSDENTDGGTSKEDGEKHGVTVAPSPAREAHPE